MAEVENQEVAPDSVVDPSQLKEVTCDEHIKAIFDVNLKHLCVYVTLHFVFKFLFLALRKTIR